MKKYIQRSASGSPGTKWHSYPRCTAIKPDSKVILAPESMLKSYGITEKCALCAQRDARLAKQDKQEDLRPILNSLIAASLVISKQVSREYLRSELMKRDIPFNLRASKNVLSRKLCACWFRERDYRIMIDLVRPALDHWTLRIEKNDRHRPDYYPTMKARCEKTLTELEALSNGS